MDDFSHQLELLLNQNSPKEASFYVEEPISVPPNNRSPIPTPPIDQNTAVDIASADHYPFFSPPFDPLQMTSNNDPAFVPTPFLPPSCDINFIPSFFPENLYHILDSYPPPQQQPLPLMGYVGLNCINQTPYMDMQNTFDFQNRSYLNPSGDPLGPNWEAINAYLSGQVRQGPEDVRIFRCSICGVEFPNAQAFGGHMSSHSKSRRQKNLAPIKPRFKRVGSKKSKSSLDVLEQPSLGNSNKLDEMKDKVENNKGKEAKSKGLESKELLSSEFVTVNEIGSCHEGCDE